MYVSFITSAIICCKFPKRNTLLHIALNRLLLDSLKRAQLSRSSVFSSTKYINFKKTIYVNTLWTELIVIDNYCFQNINFYRKIFIIDKLSIKKNCNRYFSSRVLLLSISFLWSIIVIDLFSIENFLLLINCLLKNIIIDKFPVGNYC